MVLTMYILGLQGTLGFTGTMPGFADAHPGAFAAAWASRPQAPIL